MKKINLRFILFCLLLMCALTGCGKKKDKEEATTTTEQVTTEEATVATTEEVPDTHMNLLTGENTLNDGAVGKRPVAVMVNNSRGALPQDGIGSADILFEIPMEGAESRLMAMYGDYTQVPRVCSTRSCRRYFPEISEGFDAVYVCSGMAKPIKEILNSMIENYDLVLYEGAYNPGGLFGRDQERLDAGKKTEHTMYFDGSGLPAAMESRGERTDLEDSKKNGAFKFADEKVVPSEGSGKKAFIDFGSIEATLTYDEESGKYLKYYNENAHIDGLTGEQLAFDNVIILGTTIGNDPNGTHVTVDWSGGDNAYYLSGGGMQKISWKKDGIESQMKFYDANGDELAINPGKTYIGISSPKTITVE